MSTIANWLRRYGRGTFRSWDFYVGVALGCVGAGASLVRSVRDAAVPILLAEAAVGVALTATVLAAMAIVATFFDPTYRRVLDLAGGFRAALMPYAVVGVVSAAGGAVGLIGALLLPALGKTVGAIDVGLSTLLFGWALAGTVAITELTLFHASQRASLMSGADQAETIRAKRLSDRQTS